MLQQITGTTQKPLNTIVEDMRGIVSRICHGIDEMHLLGNKALVVRAEIDPGKLLVVADALASGSVEVDARSLTKVSVQGSDKARVFTRQVKSYSDDTDGSVTVPMVPG